MDAPAEREHKGLLRRSWCMGGWPLVWAVRAQAAVSSTATTHEEWKSSKRKWASLVELIHLWSTQGLVQQSKAKYPHGKKTAMWKTPSEVTPWLLRSLAGVWRARSPLLQLGLCDSTMQRIPFNPANIFSWKGDCRYFLQPQTSPCIFYNQIPYWI